MEMPSLPQKNFSIVQFTWPQHSEYFPSFSASSLLIYFCFLLSLTSFRAPPQNMYFSLLISTFKYLSSYHDQRCNLPGLQPGQSYLPTLRSLFVEALAEGWSSSQCSLLLKGDDTPFFAFENRCFLATLYIYLYAQEENEVTSPPRSNKLHCCSRLYFLECPSFTHSWLMTLHLCCSPARNEAWRLQDEVEQRVGGWGGHHSILIPSPRLGFCPAHLPVFALLILTLSLVLNNLLLHFLHSLNLYCKYI